MLHAERRVARSFATSALMVVLGSALMALAARIELHLPWDPFVPVTGQTLALPLIIALLGRNAGTLALFAYLAEGAAGLPVFAGGAAGAFVLIGPSAGYLWALPIAGYVIGTLYETVLGRSYGGRLVAIVTGELFVFGLGVAWLSHYVPAGQAFALGVLPFLAGDALKTMLAALLRPRD